MALAIGFAALAIRRSSEFSFLEEWQAGFHRSRLRRASSRARVAKEEYIGADLYEEDQR